jgi:Ni,Fe-hydrogenase III component G
MAIRIVLTIVLIAAAVITNIVLYQSVLPNTTANLAVKQMNEDGSREALRSAQQVQSGLGYWAYVICAAIVLCIWWKPIKMFFKKGSTAPAMIFCMVASIFLTGCPKPYDAEENVEVKNNETAFVIPLESKTDLQQKMQSVESLQKLQVATKRIQISHRWQKTGRFNADGKWIPNIVVIKVDRTPITREWTANQTPGTAKKDNAIWVESQDSIGFSTGFTCTAYVQEKDAATFLYWYPTGSLAEVMDNEIRGKIQTVVQRVAAEHKMDELRDLKNTISKAVIDEITEFFSHRGITIQNIGMFGGFEYENKEIQKSIDDVFVAQQQKNVALAMKQAQDDKNKVIIMAAEAEAQARIKRAEGEAKGIQLVADAAAKANSNPAFITLKQLENQAKWIEKWQGVLPTSMWTTGNANPNIMVTTDGK